MKLISMTDFVLEQSNNENLSKELLKDDGKEFMRIWGKIFSYANFLKQPLELWMFVPCDEDGNVLDWSNYPLDISDTESKQWGQAKERCLFEGFWIDETYKKETRQLPYLTNGKISVFLHSDFAIRHQFIEDLTDADVQLTTNAQKQIAL